MQGGYFFVCVVKLDLLIFFHDPVGNDQTEMLDQKRASLDVIQFTLVCVTHHFFLPLPETSPAFQATLYSRCLQKVSLLLWYRMFICFRIYSQLYHDLSQGWDLTLFFLCPSQHSPFIHVCRERSSFCDFLVDEQEEVNLQRSVLMT